MRFLSRTVRVVLVALAAVIVAAPAAEAKTIREYWLLSIQMPLDLWDDGASLASMLGQKPDNFKFGTQK
jgi:hypothetical protein